jgi:hypothetical protein
MHTSVLCPQRPPSLPLCRYTLLGSVQQRLGGAAVVQFAKTREGTLHALKFFVRRSAFDRVAGLLAMPEFRPLMPAIESAEPNNSGEATAGVVLPACVVMKQGEPLEAWAHRVRPNLPTALNALVQIAELLQHLHGAGYVYYALKPNNIAWFSDHNRWSLIDFSCTSRIGALDLCTYSYMRHVQYS